MAQLKAATRMELLRLKKRIVLATKGHKLLKEKRDALISEFFSLIDNLKSMRKELEEQLAIAYKSLILAQAVSGIEEIRRAADSSEEILNLESSQNTIMGVKVPVFKWDSGNRKRAYSPISTSTELDTSVENFEKVLVSVIKLAEIESTLSRLAQEIKSTKRKVNALERILIPRLQQDVTYIKMRLEEMERENFSRLKVIKKKVTS